MSGLIFFLAATDNDDQERTDERSCVEERVVGSFPAQVQEVECQKKDSQDQREEELHSLPSSPTRKQGWRAELLKCL